MYIDSYEFSLGLFQILLHEILDCKHMVVHFKALSPRQFNTLLA